MKITIYGAGDDCVEVKGCQGAEEFYADGTGFWEADLVAPGGTEQMHVTFTFSNTTGTWLTGVGQPAEEVQLPAWPLTITQQPHSDGGDGYSALLTIEAPEGTRLTNVRPEPTP